MHDQAAGGLQRTYEFKAARVGRRKWSGPPAKPRTIHPRLDNRIDAAILNLIIQGKKAYEIAEVLSRRRIPFGFASGAQHDPIARGWFDRPFLVKPYTIQDIAHLLSKVLAESFNPLPAKIAAEIAR